jgi:hypothetical protein
MNLGVFFYLMDPNRVDTCSLRLGNIFCTLYSTEGVNNKYLSFTVHA